MRVRVNKLEEIILKDINRIEARAASALLKSTASALHTKKYMTLSVPGCSAELPYCILIALDGNQYN
jgi:hypothetical protein